jgi:hypothetical protein
MQPQTRTLLRNTFSTIVFSLSNIFILVMCLDNFLKIVIIEEFGSKATSATSLRHVPDSKFVRYSEQSD